MNQTIWISASIIIAGALIAGAVIVRPVATTNVANNEHGGAPEQTASTVEGLGLRPVSSDDHIRGGDAGAKVAIIEFSDFECPFCARLHPTLKQISEENDDVAWVYRHFPLSTIHRNALASAIASECVAELGGNDAFWAFSDVVFENHRGLNEAVLESLAVGVGIDAGAYRSCIAEDSVRTAVLADGTEAQQAGGRGTPFAVVVTEDGAAIPFSGALPYETIKGLVDELLAS